MQYSCNFFSCDSGGSHDRTPLFFRLSPLPAPRPFFRLSLASLPQIRHVLFFHQFICPQGYRQGTSAFRPWDCFSHPYRQTRTTSRDFLPCGLVHTSRRSTLPCGPVHTQDDLWLRHRPHPRPTPGPPVPPRAFMDDSLGPPAHFGCLHQVWDDLEPTLRARIPSIFLEAVETSLAHARAAANIGDQARPAADACAPAMAEEEHALVMRPLQVRVASLDSAHADLWDHLRHCDTQRRSTATEIATAERHHQAFAANIGEGSRQPPPARTATRPAAPAASVTFLAPTASQQRPTTAPAPLQHQAPATSTGFTAPTAVGNTMPPPPPPAARASFTTAAPWSVVAARHRRQPPPTPQDDRYLDLRLSKLMHVNSFFPANTRKPIKALASQVEAAIKSLRIEHRTLRLAVELATQDGSGFWGPLVNDILRLRDLVDRAYATPAGAGWVREVLDPAAAPRRPARSTSSGTDTASSARPRRRDDPSSGRGNSKRVTLSETSDSDDRHPRYQGCHHPDKR